MNDGPKSTDRQNKALGRIKTGKFERRVSMIKAGLSAGARLAGRSATNLLSGAEGKAERQSNILSQEAQRFVGALGELKGSVVKIGQMMALWGEHYLPEEITQALHQLEDTTMPVAWDVMKITLHENLCAEKIADLDIDPVAIGAASLGQVHRATRLSDGASLCLKIQYPNIAQAIEADLEAVHTLMKMFRIIPKTTEFEHWFDEIRQLLRREVNYTLEAQTTQTFAERLAHDSRFRVPKVYPEYSSKAVLCLSYEQGIPIGSQAVRDLSQQRRNAISTSCIDLCWQEIFNWGAMQTDPNFGNYLIDLAENNIVSPGHDQIILLDFGAVRAFEPNILQAGQQLVIGSLTRQEQIIAQALQHIGFYDTTTPTAVVQKFTELCYLVIEPFANPEQYPPAIDTLIDEHGCYSWAQSQLSTRALRQARNSLLTKHFSIPPRDFMFFSRKLIGTFTLLSVLGAKINGYTIIKPFIQEQLQTQQIPECNIKPD